jgi:hypothetical protein
VILITITDTILVKCAPRWEPAAGDRLCFPQRSRATHWIRSKYPNPGHGTWSLPRLGLFGQTDSARRTGSSARPDGLPRKSHECHICAALSQPGDCSVILRYDCRHEMNGHKPGCTNTPNSEENLEPTWSLPGAYTWSVPGSSLEFTWTILCELGSTVW